MNNARLWTALLGALIASSAAAQGPAAKVSAAMSGDLQSLGVSADEAQGVWTHPPAVLSAPDAADADDSSDPDSPLNPDNAPYQFKKEGTVTDCKTVLGAARWKYCVTVTPGSASHTVLYFLHGHGRNAENWIKGAQYRKDVRAQWRRDKAQAPIVVTVSFGGMWVLIDKNKSPRSGLLGVFVNDVMPTVEKDLALEGAPKRLLMGESMGGFNAAQLVMNYPKLFERAVLVSPALAHLSPYAGPAEIDAYKSTPGTSGFKVWLMLTLARKVFKDQADFLKSDPFTIGPSLLGAATPPLLVSCGDHDTYGLYKSVTEFVALARKQGAGVAYDEIIGGGHIAAVPADIAKFLLP